MSVFSLLEHLYGDDDTEAIFSEQATIESWLTVERALATAQGLVGVIPTDFADKISKAAQIDSIDTQRLWEEARNVGYPILPLVRMVAEHLDEGPDGCVHLGATTQDIMDTGLVLQMREALRRLLELLSDFGDCLAELVALHRDTPMAGRTHGQQAVPITFGLKIAVFLEETLAQWTRAARAIDEVSVISLHGAGGTSAGFGDDAGRVRTEMARVLDLRSTPLPWHASRGLLWSFLQPFERVAATMARFAREIGDLARTEIAEVAEASGHHRGASSTMPQKSNPILAEATLGFALALQATVSAMPRLMEVVHERATGEWQTEWSTIGRAAFLGSSAVVCATTLASELQVNRSAMAANLNLDRGLVMSEAYMMALAAQLGRERAHDLVYEAALRARAEGCSLHDAVSEMAQDGITLPAEPLQPTDYLGQSVEACEYVLGRWQRRSADFEKGRT